MKSLKNNKPLSRKTTTIVCTIIMITAMVSFSSVSSLQKPMVTRGETKLVTAMELKQDMDEDIFNRPSGIMTRESSDRGAWPPVHYNVSFLPRVNIVHLDNSNTSTEYTFLSAIPMTVFHHDNHVYQSLLISDDMTDSATAYVMEDWSTYLNSWTDSKHINFIGNIPISTKNTVKTRFGIPWKDISNITGDPLAIANQIALHDWKHSDYIVIAPYLTTPTEDDIESISNAASIAALYNAPLLFTDPLSLASTTLDVIDELGATNAVLVEINDVIDSAVNTQLINAGLTITHELTTEPMTVTLIRTITNQSTLCGILSNWQNLPAALTAARYGGYVLYLPDTIAPLANLGNNILSIDGRFHSYYKLEERIELPLLYRSIENEIAEDFYSWLDSVGGNNTDDLETVITFNTQPYYDPANGFSVTFERAITGDPSHLTVAGAVPGRLPLHYKGNIAVANRDSMYRALIFSNPRPHHVTLSMTAYEVWHSPDSSYVTPDTWGTNHIVNEIFGWPYRGWIADNNYFPWQDIQNNTPDLSPILPPGPGNGPDCDPGHFATFRENYETHFHAGVYQGSGSHASQPDVPNIGFIADVEEGSVYLYISCHGGGTTIAVADNDNGIYQDTAFGNINWPAQDGRVNINPGSYSQTEFDNDLTNTHGTIVGYNACLMANGKMNEILLEHGGVASIGSYTSVSFEGSGWWWNLFGYLITTENYSVGEAATYATARTSYLYTPGSTGTGNSHTDNSLQYVVYGDPNVPFVTPDWETPQPFPIYDDYGGHQPDKKQHPVEITNILATPELQETNGWVNITCTATSPDGITLVKATVNYPDSSTVNTTMTQILGRDSYYYNTTYPLSGSYVFYIWASDTTGNASASDTATFIIGISPEITNVAATPLIQGQNGWVNLSCTVTDTTLVDTVNINITSPDTTIQNISMARRTGMDVYYYNTTYTINGTYSYFIWANDTFDNRNRSNPKMFFIGDIAFYPGWNLVTVPVGNSYWASTLAENITGCEVVSRWDGENQTYRSYITGGPPGLDFELQDGYGYFVLVNETSALPVSGAPITSVSITLYNASDTGWNLLGWYHDAATTASSLADNISGCEIISRWDAVNQTYRSYITGGPPGLDYAITRGMGLFVLVNETSIWHGEG